MLSPGQPFDRYVIESLLGRGGMGAVYRAFDTRLERRVALKVLFGADRSSNARGLREARAAAALDHPNAVAIFDVGEHEGGVFLAMELCAGRPLSDLVPTARQVPLPRRLRWLVDVARALDAAHRAGLVHRDVKPANVMLREDGVIKVLDFGIARRLGAAPEPSVATEPRPAAALPAILTREGDIMGTPAYMAPEQLASDQVDGRADQFSWGVMAYELLAGRLPWEASGDVAAIVAAILLGAPKPLAETAPEVPEAVAAIVLRAMSKGRDQRFASCGELASALEEAAGLGAAPDGRAPAALSVAVAPTLAAVSTDAPTLAVPAPAGAPTPAPSAPLAAPVPGAAGPQPAPATAARSAARPSIAGIALGGALALATALAALLGLRALRGAPGSAPSASATAASGPPAPTAVTDLPPPAGCNATAAAAYRTGLQELHGANWVAAQASFERAGEADPACAEAQLRRLVLAYFLSSGTAQRERLRGALDRRAALGERDRLLLQAFEALVAHDTPDRASALAALATAGERFPGDAEIAFLSGLINAWSDAPAALAGARRAAALDPSYADAWQLAGDQLTALGRVDEGMAAYQACLSAAPGANDCRFARIQHLVRQGRCAEVTAEAHEWVRHDPSSGQGYGYWAAGLVAEHAPVETVEEALRLRWANLPAATRRAAELSDRARLAILGGDFPRAAALVRDGARDAVADASLEAHIGPALLEVELLVETGRYGDAGRAADAFLKRKPVWAAGAGRAFSIAGGRLIEPRLLDVRRRILPPARATWVADRDAWVQDAKRNGELWDEGTAWAFGRAMTAATADEAAAALAAAPPSIFAPGDERRARASVAVADAFVGRALSLAGRAAEAGRFLRVATAACSALEAPFEHTRAHLWLGRALEETGDPGGACAAYRVVIDRWGRSQPRSTTAAEARARWAALRCPP